MNKKIYVLQVIRAKLRRPDMIFKITVCTILIYKMLSEQVDSLGYQYSEFEHESPNMLMFFLYTFTSEYVGYYGVLFVFALLVADVVYEEYLTNNIVLLYGTRKKAVLSMVKIVAAFSALFLTLYILSVFAVGVLGGIRFDFHYTEHAVKAWSEMQLFHHFRFTSLYIPKSILNYNPFLVLLMIFGKYYIGLILLAMVGLLFSIRKDSVQYGSLAMFLVILLNLAMLHYYGPWNFYGMGISVDLSKIFSYISLQRFFVFDFIDIRKNIMQIFIETYAQGVVWFLLLFGMIYRIFQKRDF